MQLYFLYFIIAIIVALITTKNVLVSLYSILAIVIQFFGYGFGFLKSTIVVAILKKDPKQFFSELFFK